MSSGKGWRVTTGEGFLVTVDAGGSILRHFGVTLILGNVFMDANVDGGKDEAEDGLSGWTVFVDADRDGVSDPDEINVRTDAAGRYAIRTLAGGTHRIRVVESSNYRRTARAAGFREVSLMPGEILTKANFGQTSRDKPCGGFFRANPVADQLTQNPGRMPLGVFAFSGRESAARAQVR